MLERYIMYHNTRVGEEIHRYDEDEVDEMLLDWKAIGRGYRVYDIKTGKDYSFAQFKKSFHDSAEDIFDLTTTGMLGYADDLLNGRDLDYYHNKKNLKGSIVYMTPNEYYKESAKVLGKVHDHFITSQNLKSQRSFDKDYMKKLEEVITKKHEKFPIPYLNVADKYTGQEGLHRMMVAGNLYGWDTKFPVLLIENYINKKPEDMLAYIVNKLRQGEYKDWNELISHAYDLFNDSIFYSDYSVDFNDETELILVGEYDGKDYEAYVDTKDFKISPKEYNKEYEKKEEDRFLKKLGL